MRLSKLEIIIIAVFVLFGCLIIAGTSIAIITFNQNQIALEQPTSTIAPTNTSTPVNTPTPTNTSTPVNTPTPTNTPTHTPTPTPTESPYTEARVVEVIDGDTIRVEIAGQVYPLRYIGIDCPETKHPGEPIQPGGPEASARNAELVSGQTVRLEKDTSDVDKYDRLLRYVWLGDRLINQVLVCEGYAISKAYPPDTKYQARLDDCQRQAQTAQIGLWVATPSAPPPPAAAVPPSIAPAAIIAATPVPPAAIIENTPTSPPAVTSTCHPSYPDVCIPPPPPDLNCKDVTYRNFRVLPPDPHNFDRNQDGRGCEK